MNFWIWGEMGMIRYPEVYIQGYFKVTIASAENAYHWPQTRIRIQSFMLLWNSAVALLYYCTWTFGYGYLVLNIFTFFFVWYATGNNLWFLLFDYNQLIICVLFFACLVVRSMERYYLFLQLLFTDKCNSLCFP